MPRTIDLRIAGASPERRDLAGPASAGGSAADALLLPGAPPAALRLVPCDAGAVVEVAVAGVRVAGRPAAPGSRRVVVPGERIEVGGHVLALAADPAPEGTRALAGALLRGAAAGAVPLTVPHLLVLTGPRAGACVALRAAQTIGRGRRADVIVPDPEASRVHARVCVGVEAATIEDLGSKNGVRLNGVRLDRGPQPLRPGDELTVGETVLRLVDPLETLARRPPRVAVPARVRRGRRALPPELAAAALLALSAAALALASS